MNNLLNAYAGAFAAKSLETEGFGAGWVGALVTVGLIGAQELMSLLTANCDGGVASGAIWLTAAQLAANPGPGGLWTKANDPNPGTPSSDFCGGTSDYQITYDIRAHSSAPLWSHGWQVEDLGLLTGAPNMVGKAAAWEWAGQGSQHVIFRDSDGHLHELWWVAASGWQVDDLTAASGAPVSASDPVGYAMEANGTQHVFFVQENGHVNEIVWSSGATPGHNDLTAETGAPTAIVGLAAWVWVGEGSQHVVFVEENGHIHELYWLAASGWHVRDLTAASGAPTSTSDPVGYAMETGGAPQHVFFLQENGHVNEIAWYSGATPGHADLTAETDSATASGKPVGYLFNQVTQHVIYQGTNGHIHELGWQR